MKKLPITILLFGVAIIISSLVGAFYTPTSSGGTVYLNIDPIDVAKVLEPKKVLDSHKRQYKIKLISLTN